MVEGSRRRTRRLVTKKVTVPANLRRAAEEFNQGQFFECHETLEEIWQEEAGDVRDLYKGLIQVAAAFVHARRNNRFGVNRLLTTALGYLAPYREAGAMGFDVEAVCLAAERLLDALPAVEQDQIEALIPGYAPRYQLDETKLPEEARRWAAWGFDREGEPLAMEITVVE